MMDTQETETVQEPPSLHILYMEDDPILGRILQRRLKEEGYDVDFACNGEEGLAMYAEKVGAYDLVAVDQIMPVYDGLEVIRRMAELGPLPPLIMVTGMGNEAIAVEAMKLGAHDYLVKDAAGRYIDLLPTVITQVIRQYHLTEEKRKAERELRRYAKELEAQNAELDAFAHTVAHDLKSPLGVLIGYSEVVVRELKKLDNVMLQEYAEVIANTGFRIANIINELLLLASVRKMEDVTLLPLDMEMIVADATERLTTDIQQYETKIRLPDEWPTAFGYGPWIEEVWVNYISNAIHYGGRPPIVEIGSDYVAGPAVVRFWVRDNGKGIKPDAQKQLFAEFTKLHQVRAKGHGLGLSIVRRIVEKFGGQVGVESEDGRGSLFYFTLPAAPGIEPATRSDQEQKISVYPPLEQGKRACMRILVAEDEEISQQIVLMLLSELGCQADVAVNGYEVLEAFERQDYDVVLMDIQMPGMDGVETTRFLRANLIAKRQPYIVAVTANIARGDQERYLEAGMDAYLGKPFELEQLDENLSQAAVHMAKKSATSTGQGSAPHEVIDWSTLEHYFAGWQEDPAPLREMIALYVDDTHAKLEGMRKGLQDGEAKQVADLAHGLKGNSPTFGAMYFADLCRQLESAAREGDLSEAEAMIAAIEAEYERVEAEIKDL